MPATPWAVTQPTPAGSALISKITPLPPAPLTLWVVVTTAPAAAAVTGMVSRCVSMAVASAVAIAAVLSPTLIGTVTTRPATLNTALLPAIAAPLKVNVWVRAAPPDGSATAHANRNGPAPSRPWVSMALRHMRASGVPTAKKPSDSTASLIGTIVPGTTVPLPVPIISSRCGSGTSERPPCW